MTSAVENHTEDRVEVAGLTVRALKGGSGKPVLVKPEKGLQVEQVKFTGP